MSIEPNQHDRATARAEEREIVIVGGGPAGSGTALALARLDPERKGRILLLDRAQFPRDKTCAGGLIPHTLDLLATLGVSLDVPVARVDHARIEAGGRRTIELDSPGCCWVVRRLEFDAMLLEAARRAGVEVRDGVRVISARREGSRVRLETSAGPILAEAVVGADGAGSLIRRSLVDPGSGWIARAAMRDVPLPDGAALPDTYEFDFRPALDGFEGYAWSFPCLIGGRPHMNVGAYSLRRRDEGQRIAEIVDARSQAPGLASGAPAAAGEAGAGWKAHPIRLFDSRLPIATERALLVGDAAGVDPLLGEGISFALEYGLMAAQELLEARARGDWGFAHYGRRVARSHAGRKLHRLGWMARSFYGRRARFWFGVARQSKRAQSIGMNWYNGVSYDAGVSSAPSEGGPTAQRGRA